MEPKSYTNDLLVKTSNLCNIIIRNIFCGVYTGHWQGCLAVNRLLYILKAGSRPSRIAFGDFSCALEPGVWLFIPALQTVRHDQEDGLTLMSIHVNAELYSRLELFSSGARVLCGHAPEMREAFCAFLDRKADFGNAFSLHGLLWQFLADKILPQIASPEHLLNRYRGFSSLLETMGKNPYNNLTVNEMASIMNMGRESFVKHFAAETGESPKAFFNRMRASAAARELGDPALSISEVAARFGFPNVFYFSRFFKRHLGTSPAIYRKQLALAPQ